MGVRVLQIESDNRLSDRCATIEQIVVEALDLLEYFGCDVVNIEIVRFDLEDILNVIKNGGVLSSVSVRANIYYKGNYKPDDIKNRLKLR